MKRALFCTAIVVMSVAVSMAATTFLSTEVVLGVSSAYDSAAGTLTWGNGTNAILNTSDGVIFFDSASVSATFTNAVDTSTGTTASAEFASGVDWTIILGKAGSDVIKFTGTTTSSYQESEVSELYGSTLNGAVSSSVDIEILGAAYFTDGVVWADSISIVALTIGLQQSPQSALNDLQIDDYSSDWYSSNVKLDIVPEPASIALISAGLFVLRKRK